MGGLLIALIPLIQDAVSGEALGAALGSITIGQWVTIAAQAITAEPQVIAAVRALHPALETFFSAIEKGAAHGEAAEAIFNFFNHNQPLTIPGYQPDGSVAGIHNPDLKQGD